ncbi:MFS transporter [Streptacidiphilus fuscans]|uniref:MFS transporter n=1 Tax=Streptacidiphilus fuscans TaxID=2789292 RepID=A0A931FFQ4_9ACTN|nr:MFS transporter [Streptacidiphilus fuscans]MBF9070520.1 MFS transporter [Streptacidiphilus fuscans]
MSAVDTSAAAEQVADSSAAQPQLLPLRRNWRFQLLWIGSAGSLTGLTAAEVAYPLAILALTGSPAWAGLFGVLQALATVLCGLPAGVLLDRCDRRRVLIATETVRATASLSVVVASALGELTLPHLLLVALALGAAQPLGGAARMLMLRAVVPPEQLTAALTQDELRVGLSELAGPPLGGFLYGVSRMLPFLFTGLCYLLSLTCAMLVRPQQPAVTDPSATLRTVFDGLRALWRQPALRTTMLLVTLLNACGAPLSLVVIYRLREQGVASWAIGVALTGAAVGGLLGAALVGFLHRRFRPGTLLIGIIGAEVPVFVALGFCSGPWAAGAMLALGMLGIPALSVLLDVLIFRQVPDAQRGRTITATMTVAGLGIPLGSGAIGLLLQTLGGTGAVLAMASVLALGAAAAATQRGLRQAQWPAAQG